ncbi:MAG TPA: tetratricopeptide repeat protein [Myxococcota bacterium]|nr:tetratricopeptide repeat protein [Myxococcota bacterium]
MLVAACASPEKRTLAELHRVEADTANVRVGNGLDKAMEGYRRFLEQGAESALAPEAMRRLADLKLEKVFGVLGGAKTSSLPAPTARPVASWRERGNDESLRIATAGAESDREFERRASASEAIPERAGAELALLADGVAAEASSEPLEAIALYDRILEAYPDYEHKDRVLYQKARALDELGRPDEAIAVTEQLIAEHPQSQHIDEVWFRRAEYFFTRRRYVEAEQAYGAIAQRGPSSEFYELALYKLGWTLYKQELHDEALHQYIALLDYKVSSGYDFAQSENEDASRRIADTFRVMSLSFSSIGGPDAVTAYFAANGSRSYEDLVYAQLGEFYLEKLRYQDAASAYEAFIALRPQHRSAPHFGIRVVEIYEAGGFPMLVLAAKKEFAARYALGAEYWQRFPVEEAPEIVAYLKRNLRDLANHYHAAYQDPEQADDAAASFDEAQRWYRAFLASFRDDEEAPGIHHQLAGLLLEHEDFGAAAREYEHTAYDYPAHAQAAEAGYAAIFAHREQQRRASDAERDAVREAAVASTLRFVDSFPAHEHAAVVLGAAVDDLYEMKRYEMAIATGRRLLDSYPSSDTAILRSASLAIAHSAFGLGDFVQAERAYARVLEMTAGDDESRQAVVDNLAASIYKQAELASQAEDHRAAADHFLRIARVAPESATRPAAEFDAGAALMRLGALDEAVGVLEAFRESHPEHALRGEATKQLASVHRQQGELERAALEYEHIADEDRGARHEALLEAGELYETARANERALAAYQRYVEEYPEPLEIAVETRFKIAALHEALGDEERRLAELRWIVEADASAGAARTDRIRNLAARSALVLTEGYHDRFIAARLVQPFEQSLAEKRKLMDAALSAFGRLVDYAVGEVTAAATYYIAETYRDFSEALLASERPSDLSDVERVDYERVLEEEAFPFEEQAIAVHEKNLELMGAGIYNRWIEKSLARVAELMPGRYAKFEESSGLIEAVDRYAYHAPKAPAADATEPAGEPADAVDTPAPDAATEPDRERESAPAAIDGAMVAGS